MSESQESDSLKRRERSAETTTRTKRESQRMELVQTAGRMEEKTVIDF